MLCMKNKPSVGLVMKSLSAEFFQEMKKGALDFATRENSFELIIAGTSAQTEIDLQISLMENLIAQKVDAIVLVPIDSKALVPITVKAIRAGVKVINIDIRLDEAMLAAEGVELTYVGPDNRTASKMVGNVLGSKLGKGAKVILIEGLAVAENAKQRKAGFMDSIHENGLELLATEAADWETAKAEHVFLKLWAEYPQVEGVLCSNDAMALGVLHVLEEKAMAGRIPLVGFDNDASVQPYLRSGQMLATIDAFGSQMAVQGIQYALKVLDGMENKGSYSTEFKLVSYI
ncbi:MAG: sugar transporter [Bacteroidetes bacterium]|nr:sugar transporter [Bacteroidota bacterium]